VQKLLLHTCCAPCSSAVIEWLMANAVRPTLFFYNPNIFPLEEYEIRKKEIFRYAQSLGLKIIDADYDHNQWLADIRELENEPERGARCLQCFKVRMLATAKYAHENDFEHFATTLASSRWKNLVQIAEAGNEAATKFPNLHFLEKNWRKDGLDERRRILLAKHNFYNQQYCGCEFSDR
jgi:predicted adenine nucleotide alpha hydrolase (AANH) superfamily ATPase